MQVQSASIITSTEKVPKKTLWGPWFTIGFTFLLYYATQIIAGLILAVFLLLQGSDPVTAEAELKNSVWAQFSLILLIEVFLVFGVYVLLKVRGLTLKSIGLAKPHLKDLVYALLGFGCYFLLYVAIALIVKAIFPQVDFEQRQEIGFDSVQKGLQLIPVFISLVILPPIAEEIVCRGFLYTGLRRKWPMWIAAITTSIIFAMAHLQFGNGAPLLWIAAIDTFVLSIVLIALREARGTLAAPIMLHMLKNGLAFVVLFIFMAR